MEPSIVASPVIDLRQPFDHMAERGLASSDVYHALTGRWPRDATIDSETGFDRHVLASILAVAASEAGPLTERAGLDANDLAGLMARWFPSARGDGIDYWRGRGARQLDDETAMVRDLLLSQRSSAGDLGRYLAGMIARRAMEPNHLWEDLGLRDRSELTRILMRHFNPLAARNTANMRWKRFFYRALCESDGLVMCTTPICTDCGDFDLCFGDEDGESLMAERRREAAQDLRRETQVAT